MTSGSLGAHLLPYTASKSRFPRPAPFTLQLRRKRNGITPKK
jgi:hypothetical protein